VAPRGATGKTAGGTATFGEDCATAPRATAAGR